MYKFLIFLLPCGWSAKQYANSMQTVSNFQAYICLFTWEINIEAWITVRAFLLIEVYYREISPGRQEWFTASVDLILLQAVMGQACDESGMRQLTGAREISLTDGSRTWKNKASPWHFLGISPSILIILTIRAMMVNKMPMNAIGMPIESYWLSHGISSLTVRTCSMSVIAGPDLIFERFLDNARLYPYEILLASH